MAKKQAKEKAPPQLVSSVKSALTFISPFPPNPLMDSHNLRVDLGLTAYMRRTLASPFQKTAQNYKPGATVSPSACEKLKTVKAAIQLVATMSGFSH